jgi:hypothetical protein
MLTKTLNSVQQYMRLKKESICNKSRAMSTVSAYWHLSASGPAGVMACTYVCWHEQKQAPEDDDGGQWKRWWTAGALIFCSGSRERAQYCIQGPGLYNCAGLSSDQPCPHRVLGINVR